MTELHKEYLVALRSDDFPQTDEALSIYEPGNGTFYCCLGVACEVAARHINIARTKDHVNTNMNKYDGEATCLPLSVITFFGFKDHLGTFSESLEINGETYYSLVDVNDSGRFDFHKIADLIEQHFALVFPNAK